MAETGVRMWVNTENRLFNVTTGIPVYMGDVGIPSIRWGSGNPKIESVKAKVVLASFLPANPLFEIKNGDTLEILHREYGRVDEYDPKLTVAWFSACAIEERWIEEIVTISPDLENVIRAFIQMEVNFRMFQ